MLHIIASNGPLKGQALSILELESDKNFVNTKTEQLESFCRLLIKIIQIILKSAIWYETNWLINRLLV